MKFMRLQTLMNKPELSSLLWLGINEDYKRQIEPYLAVYYGSRFLGVDFDEYNSEVEAVSVWQRYFARRCIVFCHNKWKLGNIPDPDSTTFFDGGSETSTTTSHADKTTDTNNATTSEATTNTKHNGDRSDTNEVTKTETGTDTTTRTGESNSLDRTLHSDYPQSNVSPDTTGIEANVSWEYVSDGMDTLNKQSSSDSSNVDVSRETSENSTNKSTYNDTSNTTGNTNSTLTGKSKSGETSNSETTNKRKVDTFERYREFVEFYSKVFPLEEFLNKFDNIFLSCYDILREEEIL